MRRADRLFQIVHYLQGRRLTTAAQLADWLHVSERTIYRDIQVLSLSGVPIEGETGIGYRLRKEFHLPPIMFSQEELEALTIGARMVSAWSGDQLGNQAGVPLARQPYQQSWLTRRMLRQLGMDDEFNQLMQQLIEKLMEMGMSREALQRIFKDVRAAMAAALAMVRSHWKQSSSAGSRRKTPRTPSVSSRKMSGCPAKLASRSAATQSGNRTHS